MLGRDAPKTENELVDRAQAGEVAAFEELVGLHAERLFAVVVRLVAEKSAALLLLHSSHSALD